MLAEYGKAIECITFKWVKEKSKYRKVKKQVNQGCGSGYKQNSILKIWKDSKQI